jgi:predicted RNase H-like HicB family nuclease
MKLTAALETGTTGLWYGRVAELLGTHARASTRAGASKSSNPSYCTTLNG